jgi:hypothetical protein
MESARVESDTSFSLVAGGPFYGVLRRLGLLGADQLTTLRTAAVLALFAWLPPALLAVAQSLVDSGYHGWGYFADLTVPARYLIAIWAMVATERYADSRFKILGRQFRDAGLLSRDSLPRYEAALAIADRRSSSWIAEGIILAVAIVHSGVVMRVVISLSGSSWEGAMVGGQAQLSWAGTLVRYVSNPLFLFLTLRWIWWFLVWGGLLFRISRLPLRLIPAHPDRAAGLGFLAVYPSVFSGFSFALSCVISSAILKDLTLEQALRKSCGLPSRHGWRSTSCCSSAPCSYSPSHCSPHASGHCSSTAAWQPASMSPCIASGPESLKTRVLRTLRPCLRRGN